VGDTAHVDQHVSEGVSVLHYRPSTPNGRPPVVLVHGGAHGSWSWARHANYFASAGWDCHVLDWFNHGRSASTNDFVFRGITAVLREITIVTAALPEFHLVGHSMGGLAALHAATVLEPASLVLVTPVVPAEVGAAEVPVPVDRTALFPVPPAPVAKGMFFQTMSDVEAAGHHAKLVAESSQAVWEATRWTVSVDLSSVAAPAMVVSASEDTLTPPAVTAALATRMGCRHVLHEGLGHSDVLLKSSGWLPVATDIESWLREQPVNHSV
jgi:pimeloyl-ACP methyl ester carboxylesterase